jgi:hypothetical protein
MPLDRHPSCQTLSTAGADSFRVSPSIRFGVLIIPKKQKQEQKVGCTFKVHRKNARKDSIEKAHLNHRRRADSDGSHEKPPQTRTGAPRGVKRDRASRTPEADEVRARSQTARRSLERPGHPACTRVFFPTIRAALIARRCLCPACGQRGSVDPRRINRHPDGSLESLIPMLYCQRCSPNPSFAKLTGVSRWPR